LNDAKLACEYADFAEVVEAILDRFRHPLLLCAIQMYEKADAASLSELKCKFDWSATRFYRLNAAGQNHGLPLGTKGWMP
jgi:hypothetical protein